jgi:hypothetical protein
VSTTVYLEERQDTQLKMWHEKLQRGSVDRLSVAEMIRIAVDNYLMELEDVYGKLQGELF